MGLQKNGPPFLIFIPGIMGSRLKIKGSNELLWHEDLVDSLSKLVGKPGLFSSSVTPEGILTEVHATRFLGFKIIHRNICNAFRTSMMQLESSGKIQYLEYCYDWRRDVLESARSLQSWLSRFRRIQVDDKGRQTPDKSRDIIIVAHSLGSLVAATAIVKKYIHPKCVVKLICLGAPFLGAPAAFRALYSTGHFPGIDLLGWWVNKGKNRRARIDGLLKALQSFPSVYQLLPHEKIPFVWLEGNGKINPLNHYIVSQGMQTAARELQGIVERLEPTLKSNSVDFLMFYSVGSGRTLRDTDEAYAATIASSPTGSATYARVKPSTYTTGDGTVPDYSATINRPFRSDKRRPISAPHPYMADSQEFLVYLRSWIEVYIDKMQKAPTP